MKVLILGSFGKGALENFYVSGLKDKIAVETFDVTEAYYSKLESSIANRIINKAIPAVLFKPINSDLWNFIGNKNYDVILVFKGLTLFPDTIAQLKKNCRIICCYNPDHPFKFYSEGSGNKNILDSIRLYDLYFSYASRITGELKEKFQVTSYTIPFGYDSAGVVAQTGKNEFSDKWLLIGSYDRERAMFLEELKDENVHVYGDMKWKTRSNNAYLEKAFQGRALYGDEYKTAIQSAAGVFNLLRKQNMEEQSHNMRTFEVPGYGGLLISNRTEEQMNFFEEDTEAIYFDSIEELKDKLRYLRQHPLKILDIKNAANLRAKRSGYSYIDRSDQLLNILQKHLA